MAGDAAGVSGGDLGHGTGFSQSDVPVAVEGVSDVTEIGVGKAFSCVLRGSGSVLCWGEGGSGQLGNAHKLDSSTPVEVFGL